MLKKFTFFILSLVLNTNIFGIQDSLSNDSLTPSESVVFESKINDFDYTLFKNYEDSKSGYSELSWSNKLKGNYTLTISQNNEKVQSLSISDTITSVKIDSLKENLFYTIEFSNNSRIEKKAFNFHTIAPTVFAHTGTKGKEEAGELRWAGNFETLAANGYKDVIVAYTKAIHKNDSIFNWNLEVVNATKLKLKLEDLNGADKYVFKVGFPKTRNVEKAKASILNKENPDIIWSKSSTLKTKRSWGIMKLLILIGALGFFIFGMKLMSEGLQKAAGSKLRSILGSITSNRVKGVFSGFFITGIVQSSSATTVITVSLVNAGLLTLVQSAGIMMGANIGTTITGWLISLFGFKVSLSAYSLVLIAFAFPMMFFKTDKIKAWAQTIIGFAILFWGLDELKHAVPELDENSTIVEFFTRFKDITLLGPLMFVMLGALVTVVVQSSSAAMALTLTLVANGVIPFEVAAAMILGENIGTTITAEIASMVGNVHAKRSARIHSLFNVIGVVWMVLLIPFVLPFVVDILNNLGVINGNPFEATEQGRAIAPMALAGFHTFFNLANVLLLIWFVPQIVNMAIRQVKSKGDADEEFKLDYIGTGMVETPELSLLEARKEVAKFGKITSKMNGFVRSLMTEKDKKVKTKLYNKIQKYEEITDRVEIEITDYLTKVSSKEISSDTSIKVRSMVSITNDLERIGDVFYQMAKSIERKEEEKIWFTPEQRLRLDGMFKLIDEAFEIMTHNLNSDYGSVSMNAANEKEAEINRMRDDLKKMHFENLESKDYNVKSGMIYNNLFSSLERVGDHIINVSEAISGKI